MSHQDTIKVLARATVFSKSWRGKDPLPSSHGSLEFFQHCCARVSVPHQPLSRACPLFLARLPTPQDKVQEERGDAGKKEVSLLSPSCRSVIPSPLPIVFIKYQSICPLRGGENTQGMNTGRWTNSERSYKQPTIRALLCLIFTLTP